MGKRQAYRGDPESKLFYIVDQLIGGVNTDFSDDTSPDNEFYSIVNFSMDKRGSLYKRMGFGKLSAVSEIFNMFDELPDTKIVSPEDPNLENTNDNIVYVKMLKNDNNCFRNLSAFTGEKAYRKYQEIYGAQNNSFELLIITSNKFLSNSKAWLYKCTLPMLKYDESGVELEEDTIVVESKIEELPVMFNWNKNLVNIDTIEFFDKIFFTDNNKGLVCFDRTTESFTYKGSGIEGLDNTSYKPSPMEVRKVGFNVLGDDPLHWIDYKGIVTDSIQGIYLNTEGNLPLNVIPSGGKFRINILYTGKSSDFAISFKEGETALTATVTANADLTAEGLKVYDVLFTTTPTSEVEIKIEKSGASIDPYYDYYEVGSIDPETKPVQSLNIGDYGMCEMYNRAVYYKDDTIWFSEINNFDYVPNYNYVSLPIEPTDKITKIVFFKNVYIVFTKNRIYKMINSFGSSDFQVMPVNLSIGCHAPGTVMPIENELYFASPRGLYALKSSEYREGIENLKELDTKVKKLTADVTMYLGEKSDPSIRYNGIPERACAVRYKDKYMLFLNSSEEQGDLAIQDIDVLVYQYDLRAFSEIKFPIKPTFLFMVDGALETYCTIPEKEEYTEQDVILDYDFTNVQDGFLKDKSGKGNDAKIVGGATAMPGIGVTMGGGENTYIKTGILSKDVDLTKGFTAKFKCNLENIGTKLIDFRQSFMSGSEISQEFTIATNYIRGHRVEIVCRTQPNSLTNVNTINYVIRARRESSSVGNITKGYYSLSNTTDGTTFIPSTYFTASFGSSNVVDIKSGTFQCQHDDLGEYSKKWHLGFTEYYNETTTSYSNGANVSGTVTKETNCKWFYMDFSYYTEVFNGGCHLYVTPTFRAHSSYAATGKWDNREIAVWVGGDTNTKQSSYVNVPSGTGTSVTGATKKFTFYYDSSNPSTTIDGSFAMNATIKVSGTSTYYGTVNVDAFGVSLPKSVKNTSTVEKHADAGAYYDVVLNPIYKNSYKQLEIYTTEANQIVVDSYSELGEGSEIIINTGLLSVLGEHEWEIVFTKIDSGYRISIYLDNESFGETVLPLNSFTNCNRDDSKIMVGAEGTLEYFTLSNSSGYVFKYDFRNTSLGYVEDVSGNNVDGTLIGDINYIVIDGMLFDGSSGYLSLPEIGSDVRFSNGFTIEFEASFSDLKTACKIIDLAVDYDTGSNSTGKCSINVGKVANLDQIELKTTGATGKGYKLSAENALLGEQHAWKFAVVDNGKNYDITISRDGEIIKETQYNYGGITNITRSSNFIGKSNNPADGLFSGVLYQLKLTVAASVNPVPIYVGAVYEYETTYDDFGRAMDIEIQTKGINLQYPMHLKKLKNVIVKGLGGFNYGELFIEVYVDGHLVNDPKEFSCYVDETTGQIVYDYTEEKQLKFNEMISLLGNMRLDNTKFGESTYETKKLVIPCKGKNFTVKIYGESSDYISIESLGFAYKLGKVKEQ